jgi:ketosteroid isomerase-like protein
VSPGGNNDNARRAERLFEAFEARDVAALTAATDPFVEFLPVTATVANEGLPYRGHDGLQRYLEDVDRWWDELRLEPLEFREPQPDVVLVLGEAVTRRRGADASDRSPASWVCWLKEGLVVSMCIYRSHEDGIAASSRR